MKKRRDTTKENSPSGVASLCFYPLPHFPSQIMTILTPELLIMAYQQGYFPMAEPDGEMYWHSPDPRAIIPLDRVRVSRSLRKTIAKKIYETRINTAFQEVIYHCSVREETWISDEIIDAYTHLHELGFAHSVEAWYEDELVGGLYGIALGGAFFGESMFSAMTDSSKVAFVRLVEHLRQQGFILLDSQYLNAHITSLGGIEIPRSEYLSRLHVAIHLPCSFSGVQEFGATIAQQSALSSQGTFVSKIGGSLIW